MANVLLISYDNESHIPFFPQHLFYLAGALAEAGHTVDFFLADIHHPHPRMLTKVLDTGKFDIVGLGFCAGYWQYRKAKEIANAINKAKLRSKIKFVAGGHGPGAESEYFLRLLSADAVVIGDGENAICEIAESGETGIIHGQPCTDHEAPLQIYQNLREVMHIYRLIRWPTSERTDFCFPILSSRGCKFHCSFCYRMREGFFERDVKAIMEEIKFLHNHFQINHFQFSDELLMSSERRTEEICRAISNLPFKIKWDCNGRLNFLKPELARTMKSSGCEYVNLGIESLNQEILNQIKKGLTVRQIYRGVEAGRKAGLSLGLNFIWGFPGDIQENLWDAVDFLKKYDNCRELRTIRPVTPYPGCPLYYKAIEDGLLKDAEDFYEKKHKNSDLFTVNFMGIDKITAHTELCKANMHLMNNYFEKHFRTMYHQAEGLYLRDDISFRGFRAV